jgi:hypothetical protein
VDFCVAVLHGATLVLLNFAASVGMGDCRWASDRQLLLRFFFYSLGSKVTYVSSRKCRPE